MAVFGCVEILNKYMVLAIGVKATIKGSHMNVAPINIFTQSAPVSLNLAILSLISIVKIWYIRASQKLASDATESPEYPRIRAQRVS